jgi:hypothetical protein
MLEGQRGPHFGVERDDPVQRPTDSAITVAIRGRVIVPARNAATAISSAALRIVPRLPPAAAAARTASYAGKRPGGRGSNARLPHSSGDPWRALDGSRSG